MKGKDIKNSKKILFIMSSNDNVAFDGLGRFIKSTYKDCYLLDFHGMRFYEQKTKISTILKNNDISEIVLFDPVNISLDLTFLLDIRVTFKVKIIAYNADIPEYFDAFYVYNAQAYDLILVDDVTELQRYKNYGYNVLPFYHGLDIKYSADPSLNRDIDISFVGRMDRPGRREIIDLLECNGFSISIYGTGTDNGYISSRDMMDVYRRSKIVLNLTTISCSIPFHSNKSINNHVRQSKGRIFEGMLSGALVISEPADGLSFIGTNKKDFIVCKCKTDILRMVRYYLKHDYERIGIAQSGFNVALTKGTYESRAADLLSLVKETPFKRPSVVFIDTVYHTFRSRALIFGTLKSITSYQMPPGFCGNLKLRYLFLGFIWMLFRVIFKIIKRFI